MNGPHICNMAAYSLVTQEKDTDMLIHHRCNFFPEVKEKKNTFHFFSYVIYYSLRVESSLYVIRICTNRLIDITRFKFKQMRNLYLETYHGRCFKSSLIIKINEND